MSNAELRLKLRENIKNTGASGGAIHVLVGFLLLGIVIIRRLGQ